MNPLTSTIIIAPDNVLYYGCRRNSVGDRILAAINASCCWVGLLNEVMFRTIYPFIDS